MSDIATGFHFHFTDQHVYEALATCILVSATAIIYTLSQRLRGRRLPQQPRAQQHGVSIHESQILRCNISHHRLFPKVHGFTYSYLTVGIPVRSPRSNWLLSVDTAQWWKRGWLHVTAEDHLNRGGEGKSLSEHLDSYLTQQVLSGDSLLAPLQGSN